MCFYKSKFNFVKTASQDIDVLKIIVNFDNGDFIMTPFMYTQVTPIMEAEFVHRRFSQRIKKGIHSYAIHHLPEMQTLVLNIIMTQIKACYTDENIRVQIVKATIPKGTRYYTAKQFDGSTHYVSEKLFIHKNSLLTEAVR